MNHFSRFHIISYALSLGILVATSAYLFTYPASAQVVTTDDPCNLSFACCDCDGGDGGPKEPPEGGGGGGGFTPVWTDLITTNPYPGSAMEGQSVTVGATAINTITSTYATVETQARFYFFPPGNGIDFGAGGSFDSAVIAATQGYEAQTVSAYVPALDINQSAPYSTTFVFDQPGAWNAFVCVDDPDMNPSEGSENNNCTPVYTVDVTAAPSAPTATLTLNPTSIVVGGSSTLTWSSTNATSCTGTNFNTNGSTGNSVPVSPVTTTTYRVDCSGPGGSTSDQVTLPVGVAPIADLVGYTGSVISATENDPITLGGSVQNGGNAATGAFTDSITITCTSAPCGSPNQTLTVANPAMAAGATTVVQHAPITLGPGQYSYHLCADSTSIIAEPPGDNNNCGADVALSVAGLAKADLTAGSPVAPGAVAGVNTTITAVVTNSGLGATGAGFTNLYQRADDAVGTNAIDIGTDPNAALGAGGQSQTQFVYRFPTAGTWYVRVCADKSSMADANGVIVEDDENNNCSSNWTPITVAAAGVPTVSCSPSQSSVDVGDTVVWNAITSAFSPNSFTWSGGGSPASASGASASFSTVYNTAGQYAAHVIASDGSQSPFADCTPVTVTSSVPLGGSCTDPITATLTANKTRVTAPASVTLTYTATGINGTCMLSGSDGSSQPIVLTTCGANGPVTVSITKQTTYTLTCTGASPASVTVNVNPNYIEF